MDAFAWNKWVVRRDRTSAQWPASGPDAERTACIICSRARGGDVSLIIPLATSLSIWIVGVRAPPPVGISAPLVRSHV